MPKSFWVLKFSEISAILLIRMLLSILTWHFIKYQDDAFSASLLFSIFFIGKIFFGLSLSPLGDRINKKKILIFLSFISLLSCFFSLYNIQLETPSKAFFCFLIFILSSSSALFTPLVSSMIPLYVAKKQLDKAFQSGFMLHSCADIIGVAFGVVSLDLFGPYISLFFVIIVAFLSFLSSIFLKNKEKKNKNNPNKNYILDFKKGVQLSWHYKIELYWNIFSSISNFMMAPLISIILPFYVSNILKAEGHIVAFLEVVFTCGVFIGASFIRPQCLKLKILNMTIVKMAFVGISISLLILSLSQHLIVWGIGFFLLGISIVLNNISVESVRSIAIPQIFRARIQIIHSTFILLAAPLGFYLSGLFVSIKSLNMIILAFSFVFFILSQLIIFIPYFKEIIDMNKEKVENSYEYFFPGA